MDEKSPEYPRIDLGELPNYNEIDKAEEIDVNNSEKVYLTPVRKKYHKRTCIHIKNRDDLIEITIDEAVKEGCVACKICFK